MNREIKFRVWDLKNLCWYEPEKFNLNFTPLFSSNFYQEFEYLQFTGLKDKNGKEIYEGDIIKKWFVEEGSEYGVEPLYLICFGVYYDASSMFGGNESYVGFYLENLNPDSQSDFFMHPSSYIVVGNIFENPELLK